MKENLYHEKFFDTYADAKFFAQNLLMMDIGISRISIGKKKTGSQWSVHYSLMSREFMEKHSIEERIETKWEYVIQRQTVKYNSLGYYQGNDDWEDLETYEELESAMTRVHELHHTIKNPSFWEIYNYKVLQKKVEKGVDKS